MASVPPEAVAEALTFLMRCISTDGWTFLLYATEGGLLGEAVGKQYAWLIVASAVDIEGPFILSYFLGGSGHNETRLKIRPTALCCNRDARDRQKHARFPFGPF